jgi:hypothetical protein
MARNQTITKLQASFDVSSFAVAAMKYPSHRPYVPHDTNLLWCKTWRRSVAGRLRLIVPQRRITLFRRTTKPQAWMVSLPV